MGNTILDVYLQQLQPNVWRSPIRFAFVTGLIGDTDVLLYLKKGECGRSSPLCGQDLKYEGRN